MAGPSFLPLSFASTDLSTKKGQQIFLGQLAQILNQIGYQTAASLANILNGNGALFGSALLVTAVDLGTVTTNQTVPCDGAASVSVNLRVATAIRVSFALTHLGVEPRVNIFLIKNSAWAATLKLTAPNPRGTVYVAVAAVINTGA